MQTKPKPTNKQTKNTKQASDPKPLLSRASAHATIYNCTWRQTNQNLAGWGAKQHPDTKNKAQKPTVFVLLFGSVRPFQISDLHIIAWPSLQNNFLLSSQPTKTKRSHSPLLVKIRLSFNRAVQTPQGESHRQIQDQELAKNVPEIKTKYQKKMQRPPVELGTCENFPSLAFHHLLFLTTIIPSWAKKHVSM